MSFPETTKCQVCGEKATIVIEYQGTLKESYCNKHFDESRAGFGTTTRTTQEFVFLDKEGNKIE